MGHVNKVTPKIGVLSRLFTYSPHTTTTTTYYINIRGINENQYI